MTSATMMVLFTVAGFTALVGASPVASASCAELDTYTVGVTISCPSTGTYTWAGTCGGIGVGAGANSNDECVSDCASSGIGGVGVQVTGNLGTQCVGLTQYGVTSCALYPDNTNAPPTGPPKYPLHTGIVLDDANPGYHPGDEDLAFCFKTCPPGPTPYGVVMNGINHCVGAPTPCPPPGPGGLPVGANGTCIALPWVGVKPTPTGLTPSPCVGTVGVTIFWGVLGGPAYTVVCL